MWGHSGYRQQYNVVPCVLFSFFSRFLTFNLLLMHVRTKCDTVMKNLI